MAYVDHSTGDEIHAQRGGDSKGERYDSPYRSRPISESLAEFKKMKEGYYEEGKAVLRMKMDMQNPNPQFWDCKYDERFIVRNLLALVPLNLMEFLAHQLVYNSFI